MKISVCGKGGSGKSTTVALLANEAAAQGYRVLVVDSDESNAGLFRLLGFERPPAPLMDIVGGKKKIISTLRDPGPAESERKGTVLTQERIALEDIPEENVVRRDNLMLVSVGKIMRALEGCACPFGVLSREFLKRLHEGERDLVLVDMEAGVEHFGRGVEESVDAVLIVVEPSFESIELAGRIAALATSVGIRHVWAVLSKVPSEATASKVEAGLSERSVGVIGRVHHDSELPDSGLEGGALRGGESVNEIREVFHSLLRALGG